MEAETQKKPGSRPGGYSELECTWVQRTSERCWQQQSKLGASLVNGGDTHTQHNNVPHQEGLQLDCATA